jgi:hypothetical protein
MGIIARFLKKERPSDCPGVAGAADGPGFTIWSRGLILCKLCLIAESTLGYKWMPDAWSRWTVAGGLVFLAAAHRRRRTGSGSRVVKFLSTLLMETSMTDRAGNGGT